MIKTVFRFPNGMVAVCDENGEQMPKYQGHYSEVWNKILLDAGEDTEFNPPLSQIERLNG